MEINWRKRKPVGSTGKTAREGERHRKREAGLRKNIAPRTEVLFPQKQFLLNARKKKTEYAASLLSHQKKLVWPLAAAPTQPPAACTMAGGENSPSGKMPTHQVKVQKGARVSLMACLKCPLYSCLALAAVSSLRLPGQQPAGLWALPSTSCCLVGQHLSTCGNPPYSPRLYWPWQTGRLAAAGAT